MMKVKNRKADVCGKIDGSDDNSLSFYFREVRKIPVLSREEEEKTARLAMQGNVAAREKLINSNLRFVILVAKKHLGKGLPFQDLISEGNIGLLDAVKYFDVDKGYRFITYAVWWIRQSITRAIYEKGRMIRLPSNKVDELVKIQQSRQVLQSKFNQKSDKEIRDAAAFLDIAPKKAEDLLYIGQDVISLDEPVSKFGDSLTIKDNLEDKYHESPDEYAINCILKDEVNEILGSLEDREAEIIRGRYGLGDSGAGMTLREIGDLYDLSRERVRQIEKRALLELQHSPCGAKLENYIA